MSSVRAIREKLKSKDVKSIITSRGTSLSKSVGHRNADRFRVFLSYARVERQLAERVVKSLEDCGLKVLWDKNINVGHPFSDAIRGFITNAHIFMPLITPKSRDRPWLHREEGFAMALNIPIVPLIVGGTLESTESTLLAENLQSICVAQDCSDLESQLGSADFERVVFSVEPRSRSMLVEIGQWHETRTELMADYAERVMEMGVFGMIRQRGALSSFCIPDRDIRHPLWDRREGDRRRSGYLRGLQKRERQALELHARACGSKLIIDPSISFHGQGDVTSARLESLLSFLNSVDDGVQVAMRDRENEGNMTIVGDWFVAESLVPRPGEGYLQTIFTWHAPSVSAAVRVFDEQFQTICKEQNVDPHDSRRLAINHLQKRLRDLKRGHSQRKTTVGVAAASAAAMMTIAAAVSAFRKNESRNRTDETAR